VLVDMSVALLQGQRDSVNKGCRAMFNLRSLDLNLLTVFEAIDPDLIGP